MAGEVCTQGSPLMTWRLTSTSLCFWMQLAGGNPTPEACMRSELVPNTDERLHAYTSGNHCYTEPRLAACFWPRK